MRRTIALVAATTLGLGAPTAAAFAAEHHDATGKRPHSEHVPASVKKAIVAMSNEASRRPTKRRTVKGKRAATLARDFNHLRVKRSGGVTCDIAGGPTETVTFRTAKHTWIATQSACTNIRVTRDGKSLPNLIANNKWDNAINRDLKR